VRFEIFSACVLHRFVFDGNAFLSSLLTEGNWFLFDTRLSSLSPQRLQPKDNREDSRKPEGGNQSCN
jgi:hypothetical protein